MEGGEDPSLSEQGSPPLPVLNSVASNRDEAQQRGGGRVWSALGFMGGLFSRANKDDFEKKLQHLTQEEVTVHRRLKKRTQNWRKVARALIIYSVVGEGLALGFAILSSRSDELPWETRVFRALPVFALPALVTLLYSTCACYHRLMERRDQERLEWLKAERQEKINELKEKTNYYITQELIQVEKLKEKLNVGTCVFVVIRMSIDDEDVASYLITQQLIQRYDPDPAAKAAAASILASKLGADSGLKLALAAGLTNTEEVRDGGYQGRRVPSTPVEEIGTGLNSDNREASMGLRNRRRLQSNNSGQASSSGTPRNIEGIIAKENESPGGLEVWDEQGMDVGPPRNKVSDGGWMARLAAMLVGEDPTQCYALICPKCYSHNGLARKEDFQYIAYRCPCCNTLNGLQPAGDELQLNDERNVRISPELAHSKHLTFPVEPGHSQKRDQYMSLSAHMSQDNASPRNPEGSRVGTAPALISQLISGDLEQTTAQPTSSGGRI